MQTWRRRSTSPHRIRAQTPDRFLTTLYKDRPDAVTRLLIEQGQQLRQPRTLAATLDILSQHAPNFVLLVKNQPTLQRAKED